MKTIDIPQQSGPLQALLEEAQQDDVIVRAPDGSEYLVTAIVDLDHEIALTRRNQKLMAFLDDRAKQPDTVSLDEAKRQLGLS